MGFSKPSFGRLDLWYASLVVSAVDLDHCCAILNKEERKRARSFVFDRDRRRFVMTRYFLRTILTRYLGCLPSEVQFTYGVHGKPALADRTVKTRFNLSHCEDLVVVAVTQGADVGVDLERVRHDFATLKLAELFFSPSEVAALRSLTPRQRVTAFFRCWTRKEAFLKARGDGLTLPLTDSDVTVLPRDPPPLMPVAATPGELNPWWMMTLYPLPGYVVAVTVASRPRRVHCYWTMPTVRGDVAQRAMIAGGRGPSTAPTLSRRTIAVGSTGTRWR